MSAKKIVPARVQDKYGVFWYNEREILHWKQKDFDAKAREFAETGVNIVMTFSCTHFRWSYYPWWRQINQVLAKLVKACHKHNIRVVEHHSSHLTENPRSFKEWKAVERHNAKRHSSLDIFPGLRDYIAAGDPEIRPGVNLSDCRQIDGRTGDFARTNYTGYGHCVNNPYYRAAYFDYLESVYRTGVDGIMTDDVGFYGGFHSCACKYCREKFKQQTGYSFRDYLSQRRIQVAMELLIRTDKPMNQVAQESGFGSVATFNRAFRDYKSCTPTQYRAIYGSY